MLSYRHAFHAGNFADVLKHLVLLNVLDYLARKPGPLLYIDSHAGAGEYSLAASGDLPNREADQGVLRLDCQALPGALEPGAAELIQRYCVAIKPFLSRGRYPGSPALAAACLRQQDRLQLFELHPTDYQRLQTYFRADKRVKCARADGFNSARSLLPPKGMRAAVLVDPPYELKDDYRKAGHYLEQAWRRMPHATLMLWYPVLAQRRHDSMITALSRSGVRDLWRVELGIGPLNAPGMQAAGILLVNPPWRLTAQLGDLLPALARQLAGKAGHCQVSALVPK